MNKKKWWLGAIALVVLSLLFLLISPPSQKRSQDGSTYSRQPSGYGAWYAMQEQQGVKIQRWQKPITDLMNNSSQQAGITFLQVYSQPTENIVLEPTEREWLGRGNKIVILGVAQPVTAAEFSTTHPTAAGLVKIQSSRRRVASLPKIPTAILVKIPVKIPAKIQPEEEVILSDRYGAMIWKESIGKGQLVLITTPYLGANAYQKEAGNFQLLSQLVDPKNQIYIDEYLHGYRDAEEIAKSAVGSWITYLRQTPVLVILLQMGVILLVFLWGYNQRFGAVVPLTVPAMNNSEEYIKAIAAVLERANCPDFLVSTIARAEQIKLQRTLGLGGIPVAPEILLAAWQERTGKPSKELAQLLQQQAQITQNQRHSSGKLTTKTKSQAILDLLEKWRQLN